MILASPQFLAVLGFFGHLAGAVACAVALFWIIGQGDRRRSDRPAAIAAIALTGLWCAVATAIEPVAPAAQLFATARNLGLIFLLFRLFGNDGRDESMSAIKPVVLSLGFVTLLQPVLLLVMQRFAVAPQIVLLTFQSSVLLQMLVAIGALVLLHNLYAGAATSSRQLLRWSAIALALIWGFDLNLFAIAYMGGETPAILLAVRGLFAGVAMLLLAFGANSASAGLQFRPSRAVTFQTLSLLLIGAYLLVMLLVAQSLPMLGGNFGRAAQVSFLIAASIAAVAWLPSQRARSWLRVTAIKHLFQHRYDYRSEWLRFTRTISQGGSGEQSFHERAVKALADITDSPAGLLLAPNEEAELELVARWNWPSIEVPAIAATFNLAGLLEQESFILDLDKVRDGVNLRGEAELVPAWMLNEKSVWAVVPLLHFDRLVGAVVLARPSAERSLDWEDFDLLKVVGQQLASYLAEQAGQQALLEASRFDEFNRRIAFVMHDIKNLASQLSLLARNAEKHADNPDFRADMLVTLRNSADKLNALLARLGRYGAGQVHAKQAVDLTAVAKELAARFRGSHPVEVTRAESCLVSVDVEALDQALVHLLQNAIDASPPEAPVYLDVASDGLNGRIEIIDAGKGMAPGFIRNGLFKPFVSSKNGGFGIGAFEARELVRAMGGRLSVESREGVGTRFIVSLPRDVSGGINSIETANRNEVA
ncbi:XrtA/PEP-CTERM system histidine kinase PrsK [Altererythrobacter sp.]|uniref:XrtA/PEP-CTERM system histidine kinase PrsK n=1 Tax=Altererythrobacter sp. TaxID=1872480 RepID=UPI003D08B6F9